MIFKALCTAALALAIGISGFTSVALAVSYVVTDLNTIGNASSTGRGINASGQVTGDFFPQGSFNGRAFLYDGAMQDLGNRGTGFGINSSGHVVGTTLTVPYSRAF